MFEESEQKLRGEIVLSDMPFLGLYEAALTKQIRSSIEQLVKSTPSLSAFIEYLIRWPALFSIYLTTNIMRGFGDRGHFEVYRYVEQALGGVALSWKDKEFLWAAFRFACRKLGLEVSSRKAGTHYMVDEYLRQAGVPLSYISDLTGRMLRFGVQAGLPEDDDPEGIRLWQDGLLDRLGLPFPQTARKALELDQGGYYVRLLIRLVSGVSPGQSDVEKHMAEAIRSAGQVQIARKRIAIPQVVLRDYQIGVQLPGIENRNWVINVDGTRKTIKSENEPMFVPCDVPLPRYISIEDHAGSIRRAHSLWPGNENNLFLLFSATTGSLRGISRLGQELNVEPGRYNLLLRFPPDNLPEAVESISEDPRLYRMQISLGPAERLSLQRGPAAATLQADAQPLLIWSGVSVTSDEGREMFPCSGLTLQILIPEEFLKEAESDFILRVSPGGLGEEYRHLVNVDSSGRAEIDLSLLAKRLAWKPGVGRILAELRRNGQTRTIARSSAFVWNGLESVRHRSSFQCAVLPGNLEPKLSTNVKVAGDSKVITYRDENQRFLRMVFTMSEGRSTTFTWGVPGIFVYSEELSFDGKVVERPLRMGSTIVAGTLSSQQLRIFGNEKGRLRLGLLERIVDFGRVGSIRLPLSGLAEYLTPTSTTLQFVPDEKSGLEISLVSLIHPHEARRFTVKQMSDQVALEFQLGQVVEVFRILAKDLLSGRQLDVELAPNTQEQTWSDLGNLRAFCNAGENGTNDFSVSIPTDKWPPGAWIIDLEARINRNWGPLCNARFDHFAAGILLTAAGETGRLEKVTEEIKYDDRSSLVPPLERTHSALLHCYASESWPSLVWLSEFWMFLTERFVEPINEHLPDLIKLAALKPPESASPSWVPLLSLWVRLPWLLSLPRQSYHSLSHHHGRVAEALAITSEFGYTPQEICKRDFDVAPLMAFSNVIEIDSQNATPRGFDLAKYRQALVAFDLYEKRYLLFREDWHPGSGDYLGALHYRYAWKLFRSNYTQSLAGNDRRRGNALRVSSWVGRHQSVLVPQGLASYLRPGSLSLGSLDEISKEEPDEVAQERENLIRMERLISLLALVCRWEARVPGVIPQFITCLPGETKVNEISLGYLLFIAEELLAFYLILWELVLTADHDLGGD